MNGMIISFLHYYVSFVHKMVHFRIIKYKGEGI